MSHWRKIIVNGWQQFLNGVFPRNVHCASCDIALGESFWDNLCPTCSRGIVKIGPSGCVHCGRYIGSNHPNHRCDHCSELPSNLDGGFAYCFYNETSQRLVHQFKYQNHPWLGHTLCLHMSPGLKRFLQQHPVDEIIAVPIHPHRFQERGYNQAELIAASLSETLDNSYNPAVLQRIIDTPPQNELGLRERQSNVKNAFAVLPGATISGKRFLLVDDILTTGSTLNRCAEILKQHGAHRVYTAVFAAVEKNDREYFG